MHTCLEDEVCSWWLCTISGKDPPGEVCSHLCPSLRAAVSQSTTICALIFAGFDVRGSSALHSLILLCGSDVTCVRLS